MVHTPKDYGMAYEEVSFPATDGCQIAAWYIPAKEKGSKRRSQSSRTSHGDRLPRLRTVP